MPPNETDESLQKALGFVAATLPFLILKTLVLLAFTLTAAAWICSVFWVASHFHGLGALLFFYVLALAIPFGGFRLLQQYVLYMIKAAHIAVLTKLIQNETIDSPGMVAFGKNQIQSQFAKMNIFFLMDELVHGVVTSVNHFVGSLLPLPSNSGTLRFIQAVVSASSVHINDAILSYNLSRPQENVWVSARDGLVLYAQNHKMFLKKAVLFVAIEWLVTYIPVGLIALNFLLIKNPSLSVVGSTTVLIGLWWLVLRHVLLQPLTMTLILVSFHNIVGTEKPEEEWRGRLDQISDAFRIISSKVQDAPVFRATAN